VVTPCICGMPPKLTPDTENSINTSFPDEDQCCGDQAVEASTHHTENSATPYHCEHSQSYLGDGLSTSDNDLSNTQDVVVDAFIATDSIVEVLVNTAFFPTHSSALTADEPTFHGRTLPLLS